MRPAMPTYDQVRALPQAGSLVVPAEFADDNGHMNIARYMQVHSDLGWDYMGNFGLGPEDARAGRAGNFDVEHHLYYLREVHAGDEIALHARLLGRSAKAVHGMFFLVNVTDSVLANTLEWLCLNVDMSTRRVGALAPDVAERLDTQLARDAAADWAAPVCGAIDL